jgi:hypothetical protein
MEGVAEIGGAAVAFQACESEIEAALTTKLLMQFQQKQEQNYYSC